MGTNKKITRKNEEALTASSVSDSSAKGKKSDAGRTSEIGQAKTFIFTSESEEDWLKLLATWRNAYGNPAEGALLATQIRKTVRAEWLRLQAQFEYDSFLASQKGPMFTWSAPQIKHHERVMRNKTAAERVFHQEYRLLERHYKNHKLALAAALKLEKRRQKKAEKKQANAAATPTEDARQSQKTRDFSNLYVC